MKRIYKFEAVALILFGLYVAGAALGIELKTLTTYFAIPAIGGLIVWVSRHNKRQEREDKASKLKNRFD